MEQGLLEISIVSYVVNKIQDSTEHERPLPYPQKPTIGPYQESVEFSPQPTPCFFKIHFNVILPSTPRPLKIIIPL